MLFFYIYICGGLLVASWLGWNMLRKLDKYDWAYHRSDIWFKFGLILIFWPVILIFSHKTLLNPNMKPAPGWWGVDPAERDRQRVKFMESPSPCGVMVSYRPSETYEKDSESEFLFLAADVEWMAEKISHEHSALVGMRGAIRWTSLRNESVTEPTPVPEILVNFDHIAEGLIEAGKGHVNCRKCGTIYSVSDLERKTAGTNMTSSGWIYANYLCPAGHSLLFREVMHIFRKRNDA